MKRIMTTFSVFVATLLISTMPVVAEEGSTGSMMEQGQQTQKNECLLVSMNCGVQINSIQQRIDLLQKEISKGTDVYTSDELSILKQNLEDANRDFESATIGAGGA